MTRIYLCDDNPAVLSAIEIQLREIADKNSVAVQITVFESGEQLLFRWEESAGEPDVIFLDIVMGGDNGLETAKKLRSLGCRAELIFLTANPEYVFDSFDVSPANYIIKNQMSQKRLEGIFLRAVEAAKKKKTIFSCENGSVRKNIPVSDISYFEVQNRRVTAYFGDAFFELNMSYIDQIERNFIILNSGTVPYTFVWLLSCFFGKKRGAAG